jgi:hypothetical protein
MWVVEREKEEGICCWAWPKKKGGRGGVGCTCWAGEEGGKSWAGFKWRKTEDVGPVLKGILTIKIREIPRFTHSRTYSNLKSQTHFSHKKYYALQHECNRQKIIT